MQSSGDDDEDILVRLASTTSLFSRMHSISEEMINLQRRQTNKFRSLPIVAREEKTIRYQIIVKVPLILKICLLFSLFLLMLVSASVLVFKYNDKCWTWKYKRLYQLAASLL